MARRVIAFLLAAAMLVAPCAPVRAQASNPMGYSLLTTQAAASLPRRRGALGLDVERAQQVTDAGMTFDLIRVTRVRSGSPGAQAGFNAGDQIVAVDGRVFASLAAFAGYIGSIPPGTRAAFDTIPKGGGAAQAQRILVTIGGPGAAAQNQPASGGMSTKTKIGLGAAALVGCYMLGCFKSRTATPPNNQQGNQPGGYAPQQ